MQWAKPANIQGICMGCQINLGDVLWSALKGLKTLHHFCKRLAHKIGAVPFEMKGVHILISCGKTDRQHGQQNPKSGCISSGNENDAKSEGFRAKRAYIGFWPIFIFCRIELIFHRLTCFDMKRIVP